MPLFYQHNINEDERLGVWKIEESEDFFLAKVPPNPGISHEHKRLQHLAGRYLLQQLFPDFPYELIQIADTRKPFLYNEAYHFSISHCNNFAAALVSKRRRVGVDIEVVTPTIEKIRHKFLNDFEIDMLLQHATGDGVPGLLRIDKQEPVIPGIQTKQTGVYIDADEFVLGEIEKPAFRDDGENLPMLTLGWSAKEAIYKWYGNGLVDFKKHMQLKTLDAQTGEGWIPAQFIFQKEKPVPLLTRSRFFGEAVLTYTIS